MIAWVGEVIFVDLASWVCMGQEVIRSVFVILTVEWIVWVGEVR